MNALLSTLRITLRQWEPQDAPPFIWMNQQNDVMKYFPRHYTPEESHKFINTQTRHIDEHGWGCWALHINDINQFAGFVGLMRPADYHPCAGKVEIGWRLMPQFWRQGYASEAAALVLDYAFNTIELDQVVSFTSAINTPSIGVMKKIGMTKSEMEFDHPRIESDSPLCHHVVYEKYRERS